MMFFELERIYTKRSKEIRAEKKEWLQVVRLIFDLYESHTDLFTHLHYMAKYGEICVFSIWHIIVNYVICELVPFFFKSNLFIFYFSASLETIISSISIR